MGQRTGIGVRETDLHRFAQGQAIAQKIGEGTLYVTFQSRYGAVNIAVSHKQSFCHSR